MAAYLNIPRLPAELHTSALVLVLIATVGYFTCTAVFTLFFHPLSRVPGPKLFAISPIPQALMQCEGYAHKRILALHKKYGPIVRTAPNSVSIQDANVWKELMSHRKSGEKENQKHPSFYDDLLPHSVITADSEDHARMRKIMSHGFSAQGMQNQEPIIRSHIDLLFRRMKEHSDAGKPVNVVNWYNYTTFDVIGDLAFGEPFGCLETSNYHYWVSMIFEQLPQAQILSQLRRAYPLVGSLLGSVLRLLAFKKIKVNRDLTELKVRKRVALESMRPDFMDSMLGEDTDGTPRMSFEELCGNANLLIIAGSETTASTLAGVTALLCTHPDVLSKLCDEVRSRFATDADITLVSVQQLDYMLAVLNEALRIYPAAAGSIPRVIRQGGQTLCGYYLPENTIVDVWFWTMFRNPQHWVSAESFIPERWTGDPRFDSDDKAAFQPFSFGARNCLGKNLAYAEMRLILAKLIWNYDIELVNQDDRNWTQNQRFHILWAQPPLNVYLKARKVS
ncbi:hypothetical protein PFICI_05768 [Pestalotiopsis fici W106-1]|uniref:Isotrichodermin C-15 hydroxylase n=1 Tax=Pestalotiopsis fici (strain W106-1 / CGMCC3.15140) TaxID=1229662 RepID=W3XER1_PESFW|nr:uncharacterized protein PFICI_05768 [Pestalotiopsis fici W106-1]ETS83892.1 hypothetical protein PFICI_05768 [Pestalotiopsis fici W106-1]